MIVENYGYEHLPIELQEVIEKLWLQWGEDKAQINKLKTGNTVIYNRY